MPPKLDFGFKPVQKVLQKPAVKAIPKELSIGNVKVGFNGIELVDQLAASNEASPLLSGQKVNIDDLEFVQKLGEGNQGSVSRYREKMHHERSYAVKRIDVTGKTDGTQGIAAEIRNVFTLRNEYTVKLHNAFFRDGTLLLVMEYMNWGTLEELQQREPKISEPVAAYVAAQILHALALLHHRQQNPTDAEGAASRCQVHRDIKPPNVLLSKDGSVKLADFGVAGAAATIGLQTFKGTATYMSPERIKGLPHNTPSDIWSVGIVIAECLMGEYPFGGSVPKNFLELLKSITTANSVKVPTASPEAQDFLDCCLRSKESERSSARVLLEHPWVKKYEELGKVELVKLLHGVGLTRLETQVSDDLVSTSSASTAPAAAPNGPPK